MPTRGTIQGASADGHPLVRELRWFGVVNQQEKVVHDDTDLKPGNEFIKDS